MTHRKQTPTTTATFRDTLNADLNKLGFRLLAFQMLSPHEPKLQHCMGWIFPAKGRGLSQPKEVWKRNHMLDLAHSERRDFASAALRWARENAHRLTDTPTRYDDPANYDDDGGYTEPMDLPPLTAWAQKQQSR